jgi:hypothetical protein
VIFISIGINKLKIKKMENEQNLINITFTDVMQVIASEDTCPNDKLVYIYLLNVIMDLHDKVDKLEAKLSTEDNISDDVKWYEDNVKE